MRYLLDRPQILSSLPDDFELIILPDDDPEICLYNLELLNTLDKPVVFARLRSSQENVVEQIHPSLYVPVAA